MNVAIVFCPSSYSKSAPIHLGHIIAILRSECEVSDVKYVDYNDTHFYLYHRFLNSFVEKYGLEIFPDYGKFLFKDEAMDLLNRAVVEDILDVPTKQRTQQILKIGEIEELKKTLIWSLKEILRNISVNEIDVCIFVPPTPNLVYTLALLQSVKEIDSGLYTIVMDYFNFDPATPYLLAFLTNCDYHGNHIISQLKYDPFFYNKTRIFNLIDHIVVGEGYDFIRNFFRSNKFHAQVQTVEKNYVKGKKIKVTYSNLVPLDSLPFPDYKDMTRIYNTAQIETSRGCPHKCIFCERSSYMHSIFRAHSPSYVLELINYLTQKYQFDNYSFWDSAININEENALRILKSLKKERLDIKYFVQLKVKKYNKPLIELLHETGCREVGIGMESGDPIVLADMNKKYELAELSLYLKQFNKLKINPILYVIIGFPTENYHSAKITLKQIEAYSKLCRLEISSDFYWFGIIQRLNKALYKQYGIRCAHPKALKSSINNTSRISANLGTFMAITYEKGMRRLELNECIKMYHKGFKLLGLPPNLPAPILSDINELGS